MKNIIQFTKNIFFLSICLLGTTLAQSSVHLNNQNFAPISGNFQIENRPSLSISYGGDIVIKDYVSVHHSVSAIKQLDQDRLALLDVNKVLIFSISSNSLLSTFTLPYEAIDFDFENNMMLFVNLERVFSTNMQGSLISNLAYSRPEGKSFAIEKVKLIGGKNIILTADEKTYEVTSSGLSLLDENNWWFNNGFKARTEKINLESFKLITYNGNSQFLNKTYTLSQLNMPYDLASAKVIEINNSNIVLDVEGSTENESDDPVRFVLFLNPSGHVVNKIQIPLVYRTYIPRPFSSFGNVTTYMLSTTNGLHTYKLTENSTAISLPLGTPQRIHFNDFLTPLNEPEPQPTSAGRAGNNCVTRTQIVQNSYKFRDLVWTATSSNIVANCTQFGTGSCSGYAKTPLWVTTGSKTSVPYKWGGHTDWINFVSNVSQGKKTGNYACRAPNGNNGVCPDFAHQCNDDNHIIGVDCSGFVSRCWETSNNTTTSLPNISLNLGNASNATAFGSLLPGDIINYSGSHTRICLSTNPSGTASFIESAAGNWRVYEESYSMSTLANYTCLRFNNVNDARLRLSQAISVTPNPATQGGSLQVTYRVGNYGQESWSGTIHLLLIEASGNEIGLRSDNVSLSANGGLSQTITFSTSSIQSSPGTYKLEVRAKNSTGCDYDRTYKVGEGSWLNPVTLTVNSGTTCTSPTGLAFGSITSSSATVSWNFVSGQTYTLQYKASTSSTWITESSSISSGSYSLTGLSPNTTYNWRVAANCNGTYVTGGNFTTQTQGGGGNGCTNCDAQYPSGTFSTTSSTLTTVNSCIYGGQFSRYSVTSGQTYTWTTCNGGNWDTQLTLFQGTSCGGTILSYNDDACGTQSTITWTATFTGSVTVLVSKYSCQNSSGSECIQLQWACTSCGCTIPAVGISGTNNICNGQSTTLTASGGVSYVWNQGLGTGSVKTVSPTSTTTYSVTATDANGCTGSVSRTVTVNPSPSASVSGTNSICSGGSTTFTASGGGTYSWSNGATSASISISAAGTYTVTVTGSNGCTATASRTLTVNSPPSVSISGTNSICSGQSTTFTASGGGNYSWSNGATTQAINISAAGNYTVSVTGTNGCTATASRTLTVNATPSASISGTNSICSGGSTTFTASGGGTYLWSNGATTQSINISAAGNYTVTVTGTNGCTATASRTLTVNAAPSASISGTNSICSGQSTTFTASGGGTYSWSNGATTQSINISAAGNYTVTVTGANGCTATTIRTLTVNAAPSASISGTNSICSGQSTTFTASGGGTYSWSNGATTQSINISAVGNYTVTVTGTNGCTATASRTLNVTSVPSITASSNSPVQEPNNLNLSATTVSGAAYSWTGPGGFTSNVQNPVRTNTNTSMSGQYCVTATLNGCLSNSSCVSVIVNSACTPPSASISGNNTICTGQTTSFTASGGGTYSWSNGATSQSINISAAGSYTVTVTGTNGCTATASRTLTVNALPTASITPATASICSGQSITLTATGGTAYAWSNGATTAAINVSPTVTTGYTVTVTGTGGCTATETRTVTVNGVPMVSISPATATITVGQSITLSASGGTTYSWSNGGNTAAISVSPTVTTNYTVTATNAAGCTAVSSRLVTVNPVNSVFIKPDNVQVSGNSVVFTYPTSLGTVANLNPSFISIIGEATGFKTGTLTQQGNLLTFNCNSPINPGELLHIIIKKGMRNTAGDSLAAFNKIIYAPAATASCGLFDTVSAGIKFPSTVYSYSINTADFDKNGTQDIVCHYYNSYGAATNLVVLLRNTNGTFQPSVTYTNSQSHSGIIGTPDLNNDGYPDIVVNHNVPSSVAVWLNNGNGTFPASPSLYAVSNYSNGARILDIDNDGFLDIVSYSGISNLAQNRVSVLRNNGNGTFAAQVVYSTNSGFGSQLQPIDINNDGWIDLAYTSNTAFNSQPSFQLFQNNQSGQVTNILNQPNASEWYVNGVADFNADGNEDLLVGRSNAGAIWWGDGNAGFNANTNLNSLTEQFTSIGDIDGDGKYDLVVKHQRTNPTGQNPYTVHRNLGNGNFATITANRGYAKFGAPKTQDLNGDGALDYFYVGNNDSIYIAINRAKPIVIATANPNPTCHGQSATISATSGFSNFAWSNSSTNSSFQTSSAGQYSVTVTDAVGCTNTASVTLNLLAVPTVTISPTSATICNGQNVTLTASGGTSYVWSNGGGNNAQATFSPTANTTYTVTVTGANGCTATASRLVTVNANPTATISPATIAICNGQSTTLTASGGTSYVWSNGGGNNPQSTFSPTTNTTYTVTVTGANGCTATASRLVTVNANPTATISPATIAICNGQSTTLTASGGGNYIWSNGGGNNAQATFSPTVDTTYTVTVTGANGCTATASRLVTVNSLPNAAINGPSSICSGLLATLTASGGGTYLWSNGLGTNASVTVTPLQTTAYTVTVTNSNNCSATTTQTVSVQSSPSATISGPSSVCLGDSIILTANGGNTYIWANGLGNNAAISVSPLSNTTYTVTVSVGSNCTATASKTVTISQSTSSVQNRTICKGGSFNFNGKILTQAGVYKDTIVNNLGCDSIITLNLTTDPALQGSVSKTICNGSSYLFNGQVLTQSGTYTTTVQTSAGCDSVITLNLIVLNRIEQTVNAGICFGQSYPFNGKQLTQSGHYFDTLQTALGCDSFVTLNLSVGTFASTTINHSICSGQSYFFKGTALTQSGTYRDTLYSSVGCDSIVILNLTVIQPSHNNITAVLCNNNPYYFNGTQLTTPGTYTFTLTASSGCDSIVILTLNSITTAPVSAALNTSSTTICPNQLVTATVFVQNNTGNIDYQWSLNGNLIFNPSSVLAISSLQDKDSIQATVVTKDGCGNIVTLTSNTLVFNVQNVLAKPIIAYSDSVICPGDSVKLSTTQNYNTYFWSNGSNAPFIFVKTSGPHTVQVSNACGVANSDPLLLKASILIKPTVILTSNDVLSSSVSGISYQWYRNGIPLVGIVQPSIIATVSANYSVEVTDSLGCSFRSDDFYVSLSNISSITDLTVKVYPSPFDSKLIIAAEEEIDDLTIYDKLGKVVYDSDRNEKLILVNTELWANGVYNIVAKVNGNLKTFRVLKLN